MSEALNYLEFRLAKAKNFDEAAVLRKMIKQWSDIEQEAANRAAGTRETVQGKAYDVQ